MLVFGMVVWIVSEFVQGGGRYLESMRDIFQTISRRSISLSQWKISTKSSSTDVGISDGNLNSIWICARWWLVFGKCKEYFRDDLDEIYQFKAMEV
jgi:hypothetical protein